MATFDFYLASSLEKVFPTQKPAPLRQNAVLSAWRGSRAAVQLIYYTDGGAPGHAANVLRLLVNGGPSQAVLRTVDLVPSDYPCCEESDDNYITKDPGLFPDLLTPLDTGSITPIPRQYRSIWISWDIPTDAPAGDYDVSVTVSFPETPPDMEFVNHLVLRVGKASLPSQELIHTEWFHTDGLSTYYHVTPFGDEHWRIIDRFMSEAGNHGINMILTPIFTPPLDTAVGGERLTAQLVKVWVNNGKYSFDFSGLMRWTSLCKKNKITYLEISHLFTQWGAKATPKVMAEVDGVYKPIFGWNVPACSPEYRKFLKALLPQLKEKLLELGYDGTHVYYHISDEPSEENLEYYRAAKAQTEDLLEGCRVMDALSSYQFYRHNLVKCPVPSNDHIQPFIDAGVPDLWVYYCCAQGNHVPNRFYSMPSARNRIMGVLMYLYNIKGFLHWGYNFYNARNSVRPIDPYRTTHGGYAFPSGDPYLVYPGPNGQPYSSIRAEVQDEALFDLRALKLLESLAGRDFTESLIYEDAAMKPMTFRDYPRDADYLLNLREKAADAIDSFQV